MVFLPSSRLTKAVKPSLPKVFSKFKGVVIYYSGEKN